MFKKIIEPFILGVIVSFYFFPIAFTFLPESLNSKVLLALVGAFLFIIRSVKERTLSLSKHVFFSACLALLFSALCYLAILFNNTNDTTYVTYIVSFGVWIAGAYGVYRLLRIRYDSVTIPILTKYLMWVGVAQCISALLLDNVPVFKSAVSVVFYFGSEFLDDIGRMYGLGAALDPGGVRFSIILVLIAHDVGKRVFSDGRPKEVATYFFCFFFIILIGNMISRTTTVGAIIGLAFMLWSLSKIKHGFVSRSIIRSFLSITTFLVIAIPIVVFLYNNSPMMHSHLRFGFEGFFNWIETGVWRTDSTDKLNAVMWVWPNDTKTWIIGSGIIDNFAYSTDIGYCRFILYCGLVGFGSFSLFFVYNAFAIAQKFKGITWLSFMLLVLTFVIWIKVSTDIFQIYALLFCLDRVLDEDEQEETGKEKIDSQPADDLDAKLARWAARPVGNDNQ